MKRHLFAILIGVLLFALLLTGCTSRPKTGITHHWDCGTPVAARFYWDGRSENVPSEELPSDRVAELVSTLDAMEYRTHGFHSDYYWHGVFGIELELDDGTFLDYDGTCLELRSVSILQSSDNETQLHKEFVEMTGGDFWEVMGTFFEAVNETPVLGTW